MPHISIAGKVGTTDRVLSVSVVSHFSHPKGNLFESVRVSCATDYSSFLHRVVNLIGQTL